MKKIFLYSLGLFVFTLFYYHLANVYGSEDWLGKVYHALALVAIFSLIKLYSDTDNELQRSNKTIDELQAKLKQHDKKH